VQRILACLPVPEEGGRRRGSLVEAALKALEEETYVACLTCPVLAGPSLLCRSLRGGYSA
jgi:hypothetical protein